MKHKQDSITRTIQSGMILYSYQICEQNEKMTTKILQPKAVSEPCLNYTKYTFTVTSLYNSPRNVPMHSTIHIYPVLVTAAVVMLDTGTPYTTMDLLYFQHEKVITFLLKCRMELIFHSQTSTIKTSKFETPDRCIRTKTKLYPELVHVQYCMFDMRLTNEGLDVTMTKEWD